MTKFNGYQIRKSGKIFFRIYSSNGEPTVWQRVRSIEAAQALILSQGRTMTRREWSLVHSSPMPESPTLQQAASENAVSAGILQGII